MASTAGQSWPAVSTCPRRTWYNYETGVTVPAEVLLGFIEQTGANPTWLLNGDGARYRHSNDDRLLSELTPVELIRRGLEELERSPSEMVVVAPENLPGARHRNSWRSGCTLSPRSPTRFLTPRESKVTSWHTGTGSPNPTETIGTRLTDDAMHPILPAGSIVAVDRSVTDPLKLHGQIVAARPGDHVPMIRWLDVSGRHVILRPNQQRQGVSADSRRVRLEE